MTFDLLNRRAVLKGGLTSGLLLGSGLPSFAQSESGPREVLEMVKGADDAPVTVVEYASFTCPHCARFHTSVFPEIRANFIDTGKVRFVMREVYFDRFGLWAGMLARCAGPDRYFGVVDLLFERQSEWVRGSDPAVIVDSLYAIGRQAGMKNEDMEACMQDGDFAKALVAEYQKNAEADDVRGTPSFIINGNKQENVSYSEFEAVLNAALES